MRSKYLSVLLREERSTGARAPQQQQPPLYRPSAAQPCGPAVWEPPGRRFDRSGAQNWRTAEQETTRLEEQRKGTGREGKIEFYKLPRGRGRGRGSGKSKQHLLVRSLHSCCPVHEIMSGDSDRTEDEPVGSLSDCNGARGVLTIPASRTREPRRGIE